MKSQIQDAPSAASDAVAPPLDPSRNDRPDSSGKRSYPDTSRAGALRSEIVIALQTRAASKLWHGRRDPSDRGKGLIGIPQFAALVRSIAAAAAQDDPYADWWLLRLQEGLQDARAKMQRFAETVDQYTARFIPEGLTVGEALSVNAENAEAHFATPFGFMAAYVVADFDKVARKILLARHIALLDRANSERMLHEGVKIVRGALTGVLGYRYTGVQRSDVAANNSVAQRAIDAMGQCPAAVLAGEQRSDFAPAIRNATKSLRSETARLNTDSERRSDQIETTTTLSTTE